MHRLILAGLLAAFLPGCGQSGFSPQSPLPGGFGATPGGLQDIGLARELVTSGRVPPSEAITVEGMLSEHDLPLEGPECSSPLCLRGTLGWENDSGWAQLGLSSAIDPETYRRPSLGLVLLVDVSGSMGWQYGEYGMPAQVAHDVLRSLVDRFTSSDEVGIAAFETEARIVLDFVAGDAGPALMEAIDGLQAGSTTNMEAGLLLAEDMFRHREFRASQKRILLLTDAQANVGAVDSGSFLGIAERLAAQGIGLTVVGTGVGLNPELLEAMIHLRGGNGFSIPDAGSVPEFLEDQWPWMVSPVAYDLAVGAIPTSGFRELRGYGFPGDGGSLRAATVFLSRRRGALVIQFTGGSFHDLGVALSLEYTTLDGERIGERMDLRIPADAGLDEHGRYFDQSASARTVALALLVEGMKAATTAYASDYREAVSMMEAAAERYRLDAKAILARDASAREPVVREGSLADALLELMRAHAPQGTLYGGF